MGKLFFARNPLKRGGFSCFRDTPHREAIEGGVLVTVGMCSPGPMAVLTVGSRVLLRQHRTQQGTVDGYCRDFWDEILHRSNAYRQKCRWFNFSSNPHVHLILYSLVSGLERSCRYRGFYNQVVQVPFGRSYLKSLLRLTMLRGLNADSVLATCLYCLRGQDHAE